MMSKIKNMYKSFFGINEAKINVSADQLDDPGVQKLMQQKNDDTEINITEEELEEAQLINHMTDYKGGVQYMLRDAAMADQVAHEIRNFATKKKIYIITHKKSRDGRFGYFHFRLGADPAKESQQIQGYISSKPEVKHFRFKLLNEKPKPRNPNI
jgi:hypothetical protein